MKITALFENLLLILKGFFIPPKEIKATYTIIAINTMIFLIMVISGMGFKSINSENLFNWGGVTALSVYKGHYLRLVTASFLHLGYRHLFLNMISIYILGGLLEPKLGSKRFVFLFLFTGTIAIYSSLLWLDGRVTAGASGGVFGLLGAYFALALKDKTLNSSNTTIACLVGLGFILPIFLPFLSSSANHVAHGFGFFHGFMFAYLLKDQLISRVPDLAK